MGKWQKARSMAEVLEILGNARRGYLRLESGQVLRFSAYPHERRIFVYGRRKRRWGHYYGELPSSWGSHVLVCPREEGPQAALRNLGRAARYVLRYTPPDVWPELREQAEKVLARWHELEDVVRGGDYPDNYLRQEMGVYLLRPDARTTTLRTEGAERGTIDRVAEAFARRAEFEERWSGRYDCTAGGRPARDGSYYAWLCTYYRDLLNGHEWTLLDGYRALYVETD
jgi:hypothetical protein